VSNRPRRTPTNAIDIAQMLPNTFIADFSLEPTLDQLTRV